MNELFIYDEIGPDYWGLVSAKSVIEQLAKFGATSDVTVRINSPGGSVTEGQAIYNALLRHKGGVIVEIDGIAASMGSYIAMAGKTIRIAENAMLMVHNPFTIALGTADELRDAAAVLDKFQSQLRDTYAARSGISDDEIAAMMNEETWLTAAEAIDKGLADELGQPLNAAATVKPGMFAKTPDRFVATVPPPPAQKRIEERASRIEQVQQQLRISRARAGV